MGLYGCVDVQGAWGITKAIHKAVKTVVQALICVLWPGKFPGHHVLQKTAKGGTDTSGWVHMDSIGCIGPHEQRGTKKRGERPKNWCGQGIFACVSMLKQNI